MKFIKEQYLDLGEFNFNDLALPNNEEFKFELFLSFDDYLQGQIISFGFNDTIVNDLIFEEVCSRLGMTTEEYYKSEIAKNFFEKCIFMTPVLLNKVLNKGQ